jgi:hypothetical protein
MKKTFLLFILILLLGGMTQQVWGQTTVFVDDFSTEQNAAWTTSGTIGSSSWSVNRSGADWGARRNTSPAQLELTNDASGTANVNGWVFANVSTSGFSSPYNTTLNSNTGTVTWTFNMRQIRPDPAGFGSGSYGVAFILAGSSQNANNTGSGYAVVLGQSGSTDPIRLAKYNNGLGTLTNILTSNTSGLTDFGAEYLSIKVTYNPSTNTWELFLRNDGSSAFADPSAGSLTSQGTAVDNAYTGIELSYLGGYWQGSTGANLMAFFDNVKVTVAEAGTPSITINPSSLTGFNYIQGSGPSSEQSFIVSGANLNEGITLTAPTNYEISEKSGADFTNKIVLGETDGSVGETTIYVRLKAGLSGGNYNDENITAASDGATDKTVTCSGYVEAPLTTTLPYSETFNSNLAGVYTYSVSGATKVWVHDGTGAASMNGYNSGDIEEDWLILPGINLNNYTNEVLTFQSWYQYGNDDADNYLKLFYSTDYNGLGNPTSATWTELSYTKPSTATTFTSSGNIELGAINGTSVYIGFKYRGVLGGYRSWKIDNISIEEADVIAPSSFTANASSTSQINLSWAQNSSNDNVLIVFDTDNSFTEPFDGETYSVSSNALGGTIIHNASATSFEHNGLDPNTTYYYKAWSVDGSNNYSDGVIANAKTLKNEPSNHVEGFTASSGTPTTSAINLTWTDAAGDVVPDGYLIKGSSTSYAAIVDPVDGTAEYDGALIKNITQGTQTATFSGLTENTTYYFKIFPYTNSGTNINYKTNETVPQASTTTDEQTWLEDFEAASKGSYDIGNITGTMGSWELSDALIGSTLNDRKNGAKSGRVRNTGHIMMNFDKSEGAGTVKIYHAKYGTDTDGSWKLQYSTNDGTNWNDLGNTVSTSSTTLTEAEFTVNIPSNVRFKIVKLTGNRINFDDISITAYSAASQVSQTVNSTGLVQFNSQPTALVMNIGSILGEGDITCQRHLNAPNTTSGISESNISNYRWVIVKDAGITSINTELRFYLKDIPNHGISEGATGIKLYKRSTPGSGDFELVGTLTYVDMGAGQNDDYLSISNVTSFSEFVFASNDEGLPVELASLTASTVNGNVKISWQTATEVNNYGFEVERSEKQEARSEKWEKIGFVKGNGNSNSTKNYSFTDNAVSKSGKYAYRLKQVDNDGSFTYSQIVETDVTVNLSYTLGQNYPNPFNPTTKISYTIPETGLVTLKVYNIVGEHVAELVNKTQEAGKYEIEFNGSSLSNGVYFYELKANGFTSVKKLMLLK